MLDLVEWELAQREKNMKRVYGEVGKVDFSRCPWREKHYEHTDKMKNDRLCADSKLSRKRYQRSIRQEFNSLDSIYVNLTIYARDYKTYGYLDW